MNNLSGEGFQILLVEDHAINREVAKNILRSMGFGVMAAENGKEALDWLEKEGLPDLVLMDGEMPEMDGFEATIKIRKRYGKSLPVIALTAHALKGDRERFLAAGMDDYLTKPLRKQALGETLAKYLYSRHGETGREPAVAAGEGPAIDREALVAIVGESPLVQRVLLRNCIENQPQEIEIMGRLLEKKDYEALGKMAHKLTGALKYLAANRAASYGERLQQLLCEGAVDRIPAVYETLCIHCVQVCKEAREMLDALGRQEDASLPARKD
ncbi:CheY-like chemotaxis protein [Desulfobotulus alkaliphilus]|uniref:CheY-like chemotaxis protein n=1 Tax=Desulfobotulus alkaliphilus TaxID=622671 RepID=A0A562RS31_9BACT|nr:response regulator [Desulfobotulus alkaliphilus]TWI71723.1 CheY-like chemotaxis protein [Desulfobotulus alkaliphilus]